MLYKQVLILHEWGFQPSASYQCWEMIENACTCIFSETNSAPLGAWYFDGLVQDCSNSSANALELLQSCTKPLIYSFDFFCVAVCATPPTLTPPLPAHTASAPATPSPIIVAPVEPPTSASPPPPQVHNYEISSVSGDLDTLAITSKVSTWHPCLKFIDSETHDVCQLNWGVNEI